jgi:hypothetical protein
MSLLTHQGRFCNVFVREPPTEMLICKLYELFDQNSCTFKVKIHGRRQITEAQVTAVRVTWKKRDQITSFPRRRNASAFSKECDGLLKSQVPRKNGLAGAALPLGHRVRLTLLPFLFPFGDTLRVLYACHHSLPLC